MKHFDEKVAEAQRVFRDNYIDKRWGQLYGITKDASESALKYLFTINAGGAVAILAYIGSSKTPPHASIKISLVLFFAGIVFVGLHKAYMVHKLEYVFKNYKILVEKYYGGGIGWNELTKTDETNVGKPIAPYFFAYGSFLCFLLGCVFGTYGVL